MVLTYDLGTGGVKASLFSKELETLARVFIEYETQYPAPGWHEQRPQVWWESVCKSTRLLLEKSGARAEDIGCVALSGHSLVVVPLDERGEALLDSVPIWSDTRAAQQAEHFFTQVDNDEWYMRTGNGFPAACYPIFKLMWMRENQPEVFAKTRTVLGSKDYINYLMTGVCRTDLSYASGSGAYDLRAGALHVPYLDAAGLSPRLFPDIVPAHTIVGGMTPAAAQECGLRPGTPVACGGVDNACMALGAVGDEPGKVYVSLGSSSWIPVNSREPVLDVKKRPYVFAHIGEGTFTSAYSIFSGGNSLRWVRDTICGDLAQAPDAYDRMSAMAAQSPPGAGGIFFNPSLAGGTMQDKSPHIRGAYLGLHLGADRPDLVRAAMEGIAYNLRLCLDDLAAHTTLSPELLFCGGGSKSAFWMQLFADIFQREIITTNIDQDAASVGAAAICARAMGMWTDYRGIAALHIRARTFLPQAQASAFYQKQVAAFRHITDAVADLGDYMEAFKQS